jgi:hypothetical protein
LSGPGARAELPAEPTGPPVIVDQERFGVVRSPERLAVQAHVQLPPDATGVGHHRGSELPQPVVQTRLACGAAENQVGLSGLERRQVEGRDLRHHLDPPRAPPQICGEASAGHRRPQGTDAERQRVVERVRGERDRALGVTGHLRLAEGMLDLERPFRLP